jgi:hypothetical protein
MLVVMAKLRHPWGLIETHSLLVEVCDIQPSSGDTHMRMNPSSAMLIIASRLQQHQQQRSSAHGFAALSRILPLWRGVKAR